MIDIFDSAVAIDKFTVYHQNHHRNISLKDTQTLSSSLAYLTVFVGGGGWGLRREGGGNTSKLLRKLLLPFRRYPSELFSATEMIFKNAAKSIKSFEDHDDIGFNLHTCG